MSTGKLTATVFMAGPEDKLGVVDVYEQASDSIVNSHQEQFHNVMDSLDGFLSGVSGFAKGLKGGLDFINSNLNAIMSTDCDYWEVAGVDFVDVAYGIFTRKVNNGKNSADHWNVHDNRVYGYYRESGMQFNGNSNQIESNEIYKVSNRLDTTYGCQLLNLLGNNNVVRGNILSRAGSTANCIGILFE